MMTSWGLFHMDQMVYTWVYLGPLFGPFLIVTPLQGTKFELGCSNLFCELKMVTSWRGFHMDEIGPYFDPLNTIILSISYSYPSRPYKSHHLSHDVQIWLVS